VIIRAIDLETTGLTANDHVCEIGWTDVVVEGDGNSISNCKVQDRGSILVNPGHPMPAEASATHHLIDEDLANGDTWENALKLAVTNCSSDVKYFAAHNISFERQWLSDTACGNRKWICTYKCALHIYPDAPSHKNQVLRYHLKPTGLGRPDWLLAHRAEGDAFVTAHLLCMMLAIHPAKILQEFSDKPALLSKVSMGKYRGAPWSTMDAGYLRWILDPARDFDENVKFTAQYYLDKLTTSAQESM
jgi:exodeoxyribonuclease X